MVKQGGSIIKHSDIYFAGLLIMVIALPSSTFLMSLGQMILAANWLWERKYKERLKMLFQDKVALAVLSLYLLHVIGLIWTSDFDYALKDLRIKSPLFILPFIMATTPSLSKTRVNTVLLIFISSVFVCTIISTYILLFNEIIDIRTISVFISHIRFSLLICFSILILAYFIFRKNQYSIMWKIIFLAVFLWLLFFLFIMESATGLSILLVISFALFLYMVFSQKKTWIRISAAVIIVGLALGLFFFLKSIYKEFYYQTPVDLTRLEKETPRGNPYLHVINDKEFENGNRVWIYVCSDEMEAAWNKRSRMPYSGKDKIGQDMQSTLMRYLTSKGLRKDADGVNNLSDEEIRAIEEGNANYKYTGAFSIRYRLYQTLWEYSVYERSGNPSNLSMMQRIEFWKASISIIKENWLIGVGTGDLPDAFKEKYIEMHTLLKEKQRWRSHNQYLSMAVAFGLPGFLWFLFFLFYPAIKSGRIRKYYYFIFFCIALISMLTEDTIETQAGVTFIAFFIPFFLFADKDSTEIEK